MLTQRALLGEVLSAAALPMIHESCLRRKCFAQCAPSKETAVRCDSDFNGHVPMLSRLAFIIDQTHLLQTQRTNHTGGPTTEEQRKPTGQTGRRNLGAL